MTVEHARRAPASGYRETGWTVRRGVLQPPAVSKLLHHVLGEDPGARAGLPLETERYGDPEFDAVLDTLAPVVEEVTGIEAVPTYSFARIYPYGRTLPLHRDRPACEHSISIHLGASEPTAWSFWLRDLERGRHHLDLEPGDGVFYRGMDVQHWRGACPSTWYAQAFFHFVDAAGSHAEERLDRRPGLGLPEVTKR